MYTKEEFLEAIKSTSLKYERTAALYQAGDPRVFQIQESMAQMLEMVSQQIEVAMQEPFVKSRDATVLADAAAKGLIFSVKPTTVNVQVENPTASAIRLAAGRGLLDAAGRYYQILAPVTVPANGNVTLQAKQLAVSQQVHTVEDSHPFYTVEVGKPSDGSAISGLSVKVNNKTMTYTAMFNGIADGQLCYHLESDEYKRLFVKFGEENVIGYQPVNGDVVKIERYTSFGNVQIALNSPFSLQYVQTTQEQNLTFSMQSVEVAGTDEENIATLRELCRYPSVYNDNAVYLAEFEALLRRQFGYLVFLRVWNERIEESARGANVDNVNTLFVSFDLPDGSTLGRSAVNSAITTALAKADSSYKVKFVSPVVEKIQCRIKVALASTYDTAQVESQIRDVLLQHYGREANTAKAGNVIVRNKDVSSLLVGNVPAIADSQGDYDVSITGFSLNHPEVFRYMDNDSISVSLSREDYNNADWGASFATVS